MGMRTGPYKYRCCEHCSHRPVQQGHSVGCGVITCRGTWPKLAYLGWRLIHPRRRY